MRKINAAGLNIIKKWESCRLIAYLDTGGVWTIGWGHTPSYRGQQITQMQADQLLEGDLAWAQDTVAGATVDVPTTDNQFSAMVSLTYNIGPKAFKTSTCLRMHRTGDYEQAASALQWFNMDNGVVLSGLVKRRAEEAALYLLSGETVVPAVNNTIRDEMTQLQLALRAQGLYTGKIDGLFGPLTLAAIRAAQ